jgi:hypothetical protein
MLSRYRGERYRAAADPELVSFVERDKLHCLDFDEAAQFYAVFEENATDEDRAYLGAVDRFYLLTVILHRVDVLHTWLYDRCREVELKPDYCLDLWAREHYKSTIITYAGAIQEIITDPEITIGIFGHTKDISSKFCTQIKNEFEGNNDFRSLYPDICWLKPASEAPVWSESAFTVRRKGNPKEATVEAHGVVKGQPTSRHFMLRIYDDLVTLESVNTAEQVKKTTDAWELSDNLGAGEGRFWMIGTRYSFGDTYGDIMERGIVQARLYPATANGKIDGTPVFMSAEVWAKKRRTQRSTLAAQLLQNPLSGKEQTFRPEWMKPWFIRPSMMNVYIMGDPSHGKTAKSDRTAIAIIGIGSSGKKYLLGGCCTRLSLAERWDHVKSYHKRWSKMPGVGTIKVGWERYGLQADIEYFQERMRIEKYSFAIDELAWPLEGPGSKIARVERLQPDVEYGDFLFPGIVWVQGVGDALWDADVDAGQMVFTKLDGELKAIKEVTERGQPYLACEALTRKNEDGEIYDLTRILMEQMLYFPFATHDDLVDAASRIYDMNPVAALVDDRIPEIAASPD